MLQLLLHVGVAERKECVQLRIHLPYFVRSHLLNLLTFCHQSFTFNSNKSPATAVIELLMMGGKTPETC
jgi:hypothetical protein